MARISTRIAAIEESATLAVDAGFGTAASLRQHLHAAIGVSPGAYRRMYRGPQDRGVGG